MKLLKGKSYRPLQFAAIILASFLILSLGCGKKDEGVIKIGVILPLTGELSSHGEDAKKGIDVAVILTNLSDVIDGRKISVIYEDDQMKPAAGVAAFNKLTTVEKVPVVVGGIGSTVALAIAPIADKKKVVFVSPTASNPDLTNAGEYFFRIWPSDNYEGRVMANSIASKFELKRIAVLYINNDFGIGLKDVFNETFKSLGGKILIQESYEAGTTDFRTQLSKIKNSNPDAIYLPGYYQEVARICIQLRELKLGTQLFSTSPIENPELIKIAGDACEGIVYTRPAFDPENPSEEYENFKNMYLSQFNVEPGIAGAYAFDAMGVVVNSIIDAIASEGLVTGGSLKRAMSQIRNYRGATGTFSFDENGDVDREMTLFKVQNGDFVLYNNETN